jgi:hypothetical protein
MPAPVLQFKRGNAGVAGTVPALRPGEPAISLNNFDFFIGIDTSVANNKFFGSHRYWGREDGTTSLRLKLVDKDGTNYVAIKAPDELVGIVTYRLPGTQGAPSSVLTNDGSGGLTWASGSANPVFTGIATFSDTTDNTLGNSNTGAVQIDGGLGVDKNVTVGGNLNVQGYSEFVGVATFRGGTINLGDSTSDDINVGGEFISGLYPNTTATYDLGDGTRQWRHGNFSGIVTATTGAVADAVQIGITAAGEIDTSTGGLTLDSASGQTTIDDNLSVTGIATITGEFVANGNVTLGDAAEDTITINGTTTFNQPLVGTIGTATRALTVDTTTAPSGTFYPGLFVNNTGTASTAVYVDAGISYDSNTDTLTLTGDIAVNGGDVTTSATTFNLINANATAVNAFQAATDVVLSATTGITTVRNKLVVGGNLEVDGNNIQASDGNNNITLTSNTLTTFAGDIRVNGNDIQASDGNTNITMTSNTLTEVKGDLKVTGNDIQSSTATALTLSGADVTVAGDLQVTGNDIKSSTGATALTLSGSNVTVAGDLYVSGNTTQVNTTSLTIEDTLVELGLVDGALPVSDLNKDLGLLLNYFSGTAKKAAVFWDDSASRIVFADDVTESSSVLTVASNAYASIEIEGLWVNDCAGQSQVISCTGTERYLENITIDAGGF